MRTKIIYTLITLLVALSLRAQVNLVPNGDFESHVNCQYAEDWFECFGSCDYYNRCAASLNYSVPNNHNGQQEPHSKDAYAGIFIYVKKNFTPPPPNDPVLFWDGFREFLGIGLANKLEAGKKYHCGFYLSRGDSTWSAVKNISMLFLSDSLEELDGPSMSEVEQNTYHWIYELNPQINYTDTAFLSDRLNWTKFEGSFIADGTEEFLYIGNFDPYLETGAITVFDSTYNNPDPGYYAYQAYYYIDDVWVYEDTTTSVEENPLQNIAIYPNPAQDYITIQSANYTYLQVELFDISGRKLLQQQINSGTQSIDITSLSNGIYICTLTANNQLIKRQKIIVNR